MNCDQIQPNLLDYHLQRLSSTEWDEIAAHLDACAACREVLDQERKLAGTLSSMGAPAPSSDMWAVVRDRIRVKAPVWQYLMPWTLAPAARRLVAASVAVLVLGSVGFVGVSRHSAAEKQAAAVSQLVEMQSQSQTPTAWADDPLADKTDIVLAALEEKPVTQ